MSRSPRFFITPDQIVGSQIVISGEDVRHIATVMRMAAGDALLLCDGAGTEYTVQILTVGNSEITTTIGSQAKRTPLSPLITLGQGMPKSDKMDLIVQKATELGVAHIVPLVTERTIVKVKDEEKRVARWQKISREAAMQSNRGEIPKIGPLSSFHGFIRTLDPGPRTLLLLPWEEGTVPIKQILRQTPDVKNIVILIGPEGGFSSSEASIAAEKGFHLVSLGPNILRTETAAIATLGMIGYEYFPAPFA